ncbi:hypothetical protein ACVWXO_000898 [Bradyrhizobium sp. LM2.7]
MRVLKHALARKTTLIAQMHKQLRLVRNNGRYRDTSNNLSAMLDVRPAFLNAM